MAEEANSLAIDLVMQEKARKIVGHFNLPIIGVHHMEAHALIARLLEQDLRFPSVALPISSVHNLPVLTHSLGKNTQLGTTINDAIGEAFDKTTKLLALDIRRSGWPSADPIKFSTPIKQHKDCSFLCAFLKTQVRLTTESKNIYVKIFISFASS